ncbi:ABC transporter ATP-binding protein [Rhodococcus antarcticus]|jgi:ABC-2 type transport system ATP-binding protein|uniref:ABC transporter ATP-binding protein n=1 Tax=Rhodococcus antarcticus TaxID=2987751 RepID=A0ABY6P314_9NOCA|nr:ABC transporter ATP-binding protein [Rhodococcus antarcticus]UZJ26040.1 ABC transporter ATP-binding protein [Rhodococcus antarcticus]
MHSVEVQGLTVTRGRADVLHEVSFTLEPSRITGLLGPSGSGKTTLMRALVGVQSGVAGMVTVLGLPAGSAALRHRVGYVTQAPAVYTDLSIAENLRYFAAILGASAGRISEVLTEVGLATRSGQLIGSLSGGERARVSLATALLGTPDLLVLDEPTVGLDPVLRRDLWGLFRHLAGAGTTILVSSHVMDEASRCDRLLLLREGRLVADDSPAGLLASTGTADVEHAFLAIAEGAPA